MRERPRGTKVAPALLTEFGNAGVGRASPAGEFANHVESLPANPVLARGSVSRVRQRLELCARRVGEGAWIPEDGPPDLIGEKVKRRGAAQRGPREGRFFLSELTQDGV